MSIVEKVAALHDEMRAWRHDIHQHPETAFEEHRTSDLVAEKLSSWGIEVHRGLAKTGVVGVLRGQKDGGRMIAVRADMDALDVQELNTFTHCSTRRGKMHACGHDGHTAMLLGAAKVLSETRCFDGSVVFVFQPAEENEGGGRVMVEEGLFERFPVEAVYGMHNLPGIAAGSIAMRVGPAMASFDIFEITITGVGAHAAMPHLGIDSIVVGSEIVSSLQTLASRQTNPVDPVVVSVTQFHAGDTWNISPQTTVLRGTVRCFQESTQDNIEAALKRTVYGICEAHGARAEVRYERRYPALLNTSTETELAAVAAAKVVHPSQVDTQREPMMGAEDFAFMLQAKPGCYIWIGNGESGDPGGCALHNPRYDFNDSVAVVGASYWVKLVETALPLTPSK